MMEIRSYKGKIPLGDYFEKVREFHGFLAPGVVLGGFMVDWALEIMEPCEILDAVVETRKCLPDAVQLLTKCSIGNGWLKILDWGILAVTLYDKRSHVGARVHIDMHKSKEFPLVKAWAMKEKSRDQAPLEPLIDEMVRAGRDILSVQKVTIEGVLQKLSPYGDPVICSRCGEGFRFGSGGVCQRCLEPFFNVDENPASP
ncbi:MAG: formylmethanofuran dehydrogenase subunit E family protein [Pseudomonadota bacterium]